MSMSQPAPVNPARVFQYMGSQVRIHADASDTRGQFALVEFVTRPGLEPPMHTHTNEDEMFVIIDGSMNLIQESGARIVAAGEAGVVRRGTPHTFKILSPFLRTMNVFTPAGFEDFFRTLAGDTPPAFEKIAQVAAQFGTRLALRQLAI